jgi:CCR4-NOT transcriptional regulation complex NOT5 subunit
MIPAEDYVASNTPVTPFYDQTSSAPSSCQVTLHASGAMLNSSSDPPLSIFEDITLRSTSISSSSIPTITDEDLFNNDSDFVTGWEDVLGAPSKRSFDPPMSFHSHIATTTSGIQQKITPGSSHDHDPHKLGLVKNDSASDV